eukprot:TRINITY_DN4368_c0_g1_i1.p1 TRINITY_DN4368_c0_g1~~TRINITY_DN4368_c0_g1_i1.p1  ORF type:complete len:211 (-),score=49.99 TRINITY_DN4368_c0_g1_i1:186-818(-)
MRCHLSRSTLLVSIGLGLLSIFLIVAISTRDWEYVKIKGKNESMEVKSHYGLVDVKSKTEFGDGGDDTKTISYTDGDCKSSDTCKKAKSAGGAGLGLGIIALLLTIGTIVVLVLGDLFQKQLLKYITMLLVVAAFLFLFIACMAQYGKSPKYDDFKKEYKDFNYSEKIDITVSLGASWILAFTIDWFIAFCAVVVILEGRPKKETYETME